MLLNMGHAQRDISRGRNVGTACGAGCHCFQATSLGVSPLTPLAVVGDVSGHAHFVELTSVKQPRVVRVTRLHRDAVRHIV